MLTSSAISETDEIVSCDPAPEIAVYGAEHYPLEHYFLPGVYIRQITMPAGHLIRGCCHKTQHFNTILKGRVRVLMGDEIIELSAPKTFVSDAGCAKALLIIEDCIWQTIHLTNETDLASLREVLIDESKSYIPSEIAEQFHRLLHEKPRLDA